MPEVLELPRTKDTNKSDISDAYSWRVELPSSVKKENGLAEDSYLVLTVHDGKVIGELINVTPEIKNEAARIVNKYRKTFEEMKRIGD
jgi:hypothetical protein